MNTHLSSLPPRGSERIVCCAMFFLLFAIPEIAEAVPLRNGMGGAAGFGENFLSRNDDDSSSEIDITSVFPQGLNFFGATYYGIFVNNNGNVTLKGPQAVFTPTAITASTANPIFAPFFADVDTRAAPATPTPGGNSTGSNLVYWDIDPLRGAITVTWDDVGFYNSNTTKLNAFQLRLTRSDVAGDFDIEFRYEATNWTTGDESGGTDGLGGTVARGGWSSGNGTDYVELQESGNQASMLALAESPGFRLYQVRSGSVSDFSEISGSVWKDTNFNGINDDSLPFADVKVLASQLGQSRLQWTAYTDSSGNYLFPNLPQGRYVVSFQLPELDRDGHRRVETRGFTRKISPDHQERADDSDIPATGPVSATWQNESTPPPQSSTEILLGSEMGVIDAGTVEFPLVRWKNRFGTAYEPDSPTIVADPQIPASFVEDRSSEINGAILELTKPVPYPVTVSVSTREGSAKFGSDYRPPPNSISFDAGATEAIAYFSIVGDSIPEHYEDFKLVLGRVITTTPGQGAIVDDPSLMTVSIPPNDMTIQGRIWGDRNENGRQDPGEPGLDFIELAVISEGENVGTTTTISGGYYSFSDLDPGQYELRFPTLNLTIPNVGDDLGDSDFIPSPDGFASFSFVVSDLGEEITADAGLKQLSTNDQGVAGEIWVERASWAEPPPGNEGYIARINLELSAGTPGGTTAMVTYRSDLSSATPGEDFLIEGDNVLFEAGQTQSHLRVTILADDLEEGDEEFWLEFSIGGSSSLAKFEIIDNRGIEDKSYRSWAAENGVDADSLFRLPDFNRNRKHDLVEYAFAQTYTPLPESAGTLTFTAEPIMDTVAFAGDIYPCIRYRRRHLSDGLSYSPTFSNDLKEWVFAGAEAVYHVEDGWEYICAYPPSNLSDSEKLFARVEVAQNFVRDDGFRLKSVILAEEAHPGSYFGRNIYVSNGFLVASNGTGNRTDQSVKVIDPETSEVIYSLTPDDLEETNDDSSWFGEIVVVDDSYIAASSHLDDEAGPNSGAVYLYSLTEGRLVRKFIPSGNSAGDQFGSNIALGGGYLLVASPYDDDDGEDMGSVSVYDAANGSLLTKLYDPKPGPFGHELYGFYERLQVDRNLALVGTDVFHLPSGNYLESFEDDDNYQAYASSSVLMKNGIIAVPYGSNFINEIRIFDANTRSLKGSVTLEKISGDQGVNIPMDVTEDKLLVSRKFYIGDAWWSAAEVYHLTTGERLARILDGPGFRGHIGRSAFLGEEGVVIGAYKDDAAARNAGAIHIYGRVGNYTFTPTEESMSGEIRVEVPLGIGLVNGSSSLDFGSGPPGASAGSKTVTISNDGNGELNGLSVMVDGAAASDFSINPGGMATTLAPGASTSFTVAFTPGAAGSRSAQLHIASNDTDANPFDVALVGTGVIPPGEIRVEGPLGTGLVNGSSSLDFGSGYLGAPTVAKTITISNDGYGELSDLAVTVDGAAASDFSIDAGGMATTLAPGASTSFTVAFTPGAAGSRNAQLHIASNDTDENPFDVALVGHGVNRPSSVTLAAWGENMYGQLGDGTTTWHYSPVSVDQSGVLVDKTVVALSAGIIHTVALCSDGTVAAWGDNYYGQLGDGTSSYRLSPVLVDQSGVLIGKTVMAVSAGGEHTVALCSDGNVAAWGSNYSGELGDGTTTDRSSPVMVNQSGVLVDKTVVAVSAGWSHTMALCSDGTVAAWGNNGNGQLGDGTTIDRSSPVIMNQSGVLVDKTVVAVTAGRAHTKALCSDGTVAAWGDNSSGQLGEGTTSYRLSPVLVDQSGVLIDKTVVAVSAGRDHTVALCSDGTVAVWGDNSWGQLGDGTTTDRSSPVMVNQSGVLAGKTVVAVSAGGDNTMALCSDGTVAAWGINESGQLGDGTTTSHSSPVQVIQSGVLAGRTVNMVVTGSYHSVALATGGATANDHYNIAVADAGLIGADAYPYSTPFGDGVSNILKYAYNLNLSGPDSHAMRQGGSSGLPNGHLVKYGGQTYWRIEYVRRKGSGLIYTPQKSMTLLPGSFTPTTGAENSEDIDSEWERITIDEPVDPTATPSFFSCVKVTLP